MLLYVFTIFLGAFLLFQIEPLLARYILPWFGGTPAVWITCMLFFQLLLVAGYGYSHAIATHLRLRSQAITHIALVTVYLLLTYPFLIEPLLTLRSQALIWSALFILFAIGVALSALTVRGVPGPVKAHARRELSHRLLPDGRGRRRYRWNLRRPDSSADL